MFILSSQKKRPLHIVNAEIFSHVNRIRENRKYSFTYKVFQFVSRIFIGKGLKIILYYFKEKGK